MGKIEEATMELPKRAARLEWNLNTIIQVITLAAMGIGGVTIWVEKSRDIEELQSWRSAQEQSQKIASPKFGSATDARKSAFAVSRMRCAKSTI